MKCKFLLQALPGFDRCGHQDQAIIFRNSLACYKGLVIFNAGFMGWL